MFLGNALLYILFACYSCRITILATSDACHGGFVRAQTYGMAVRLNHAGVNSSRY